MPVNFKIPTAANPLIIEPIFFGNPGCVDLCSQAHALLDEAFSLASGLQQPDHHEDCSEERATARARIAAIYASLGVAIGVR